MKNKGDEMENVIIIPQGDCILKRCGDYEQYYDGFTTIPTEAKEVESPLILKGSTNSHALFGGKFKVFDHENRKFIKVTEPCKLAHVTDLQSMTPAEHHEQTVGVGEWFSDDLIEFDHIKNESRKVID